MPEFIIKTYQYPSCKVAPGHSCRLAVLADLHMARQLPWHEELLDAVRAGHPDVILLPGDMFIRSKSGRLSSAAEFICRLGETAPVYYCGGNHEYVLRASVKRNALYQRYEDHLLCRGIHILHNESAVVKVNGIPLKIFGLEIPMMYYGKPFAPMLPVSEMNRLLGRPAKAPALNILLAHNPRYGSAYLKWGADLTFSGHYHGGVVRITEHQGLLSPQFEVFPAYSCGDFYHGSRALYVSAGLGEHTLPLRIHDPRELIFVDIIPETES